MTYPTSVAAQPARFGFPKGKPIDGLRHFGVDGLGWPYSRREMLSRETVGGELSKTEREGKAHRLKVYWRVDGLYSPSS